MPSPLPAPSATSSAVVIARSCSPFRGSVAMKRSISATTRPGSSNQGLWPAPAIRTRRKFGFAATRASPSSGDPKASCSPQTRSVGIVTACQRSPRISSRRYPRRRQSATHAIKLSMLSTFRRACATSTSSTRSSTRSGCSTMTCPQNFRLPSRVAFENRYLPSRWPMSGNPTGSIRRGGLRAMPTGAPTSARRGTRLGASSAKATDKSAPIELATTSTVEKPSASTMSPKNVRPWSSRSTPR